MVVFHIDTTEAGILLAILLRMSIVLFLTPVYSGTQVPAAVKAAVSLALTMMLYPLVHSDVAPLPFQPGPLAAVLLGEILFGMVLAMSLLLIFSALQFAGEIISFQMGFGFAQVADPVYGTQITLISRWFQLVGILILFSINGHHAILRAIVDSYRTIPVGGFVMSATTFGGVIALSEQLFIIAIRFAAPVMTVLLLCHLALALIGKFAPQMNVMTASFPLTILLGILFTAFSVVVWGDAIEDLLEDTFKAYRRIVDPTG